MLIGGKRVYPWLTLTGGRNYRGWEKQGDFCFKYHAVHLQGLTRRGKKTSPPQKKNNHKNSPQKEKKKTPAHTKKKKLHYAIKKKRGSLKMEGDLSISTALGEKKISGSEQILGEDAQKN